MMYPIVLLFVIGLAVIIDRALAFRAAARNNKELTDGVIDALSRTDVEGAADLCTKIGGPVAAVLLVGVQKFGKLVDTDRPVAEMSAIVKTSMEDFAPQIVGTLDRNIFLKNPPKTRRHHLQPINRKPPPAQKRMAAIMPHSMLSAET